MIVLPVKLEAAIVANQGFYQSLIEV